MTRTISLDPVLANGTQGTFTVQYFGANYTVLTMYGLNNNVNSTESYVLYCSDTAPQAQALTALGVPTNVGMFKVPVQNVLVGGNYTSSYVEVCCCQPSEKKIDPLLCSYPSAVVLIRQETTNSNRRLLTPLESLQEQGQTSRYWRPPRISSPPVFRYNMRLVASLRLMTLSSTNTTISTWDSVSTLIPPSPRMYGCQCPLTWYHC